MLRGVITDGVYLSIGVNIAHWGCHFPLNGVDSGLQSLSTRRLVHTLAKSVRLQKYCVTSFMSRRMEKPAICIINEN